MTPTRSADSIIVDGLTYRPHDIRTMERQLRVQAQRIVEMRQQLQARGVRS